MTKKNIWLTTGAILFASIVLILINWFFVPGSQNSDIWIIVGNSIGYASVLIFGFIGALAALHTIKKGEGKGGKDKDFGFTSQIPETDKIFTGRAKQLHELESQFKNSKINVCGIHGMGGMGKTFLAIAFANQISRNHDYHIALDMQGISENPLTPEDAMFHVVKSFYTSYSFPENISLLKGAYQSILNKNKILLF